MTSQEFAQQIKAKYPAYQNINDTDLVNKIVEKYPVYKSQISDYQEGQPGLFSRIGSDLTQRKNDIVAAFARMGQSGQPTDTQNADTTNNGLPILQSIIHAVGRAAQDTKNDFSAAMGITRGISGGVSDTINEVLKSAIDTVSSHATAFKNALSTAIPALSPIVTTVGPVLKNTLFKKISDAIQSPEGQQGLDALHQGMAAYHQFAEAHPTIGDALGAFGNILNVLATADIAKPALEALSSVGREALSVAKSGVEGVAETAGKTRSAIGGLIKGKSEAEILATPAEQVYKLSPAERKIYFDAQRAVPNAQYESTLNKAINESTDILAKKQAEAVALKKELAAASRDEVINLRPKIRTALSEQSAEYRRLVDEEIAQFADNKVGHKEIGKFIDQRFAGDEQMAEAIKQRLGLTTRAVTNPQTTVGEIYNQARSLGEDISSAAKKGTRVYTSDEKLTDDAISTLTDFLKTQGVDLKEARQFWAQYAPVRNQLVSEAKPFLQAPIETKKFAGTLTRVAAGKDINNENFITEVEKLLGEKVSVKQKDILSKLAQNEKEQLAQQVTAESKKIEASLAREKALKGLKSKEIEVMRRARLRDYTKKILLYGGGALVGEEILRKILP